MTHLTFDDLTAFAALSGYSEENAAFASKVVKHIRECRHCRDLAAAVIRVNEALENMTCEKNKKEKYRKYHTDN